MPGTRSGQNPITPALAAVDDRQHQLWITPHGVIKAALAHKATVQARTEGGKKLTTIAFVVPGQFKATVHVNDKNQIDKIGSWNTNPVLGEMLTETTYADYKDFGGVQFPTRITQKQGGFPTLDLTVAEVKPNAAVAIQPADNIKQSAIRAAFFRKRSPTASGTSPAARITACWSRWPTTSSCDRLGSSGRRAGGAR